MLFEYRIGDMYRRQNFVRDKYGKRVINLFHYTFIEASEKLCNMVE